MRHAKAQPVRAQRTPGTLADYAAIALAYAKRAAATRSRSPLQVGAPRRPAAPRRPEAQQGEGLALSFDPWHGNDVCDFIEKLPHVEGVWDTPTITLEPARSSSSPWCSAGAARNTGLRRFTVVYEEVARKNAKSTKTAGVSLYCLACEDEPGPQVLTAATTFDQAKKVFTRPSAWSRRCPTLQEAFGLAAVGEVDHLRRQRRLYAADPRQVEDAGRPQPAPRHDGRAARPQDRGLYDVMRSAFGAPKAAAALADHDRRLQRARRLLRAAHHGDQGARAVGDRRAYLRRSSSRSTAPKDYDARPQGRRRSLRRTKWIKANPLLAGGPAERAPAIRDRGEELPLAEGEFKTKHLNMWMGAAAPG
jgi:hypothetical protein